MRDLCSTHRRLLMVMSCCGDRVFVVDKIDIDHIVEQQEIIEIGLMLTGELESACCLAGSGHCCRCGHRSGLLLLLVLLIWTRHLATSIGSNIGEIRLEMFGYFGDARTCVRARAGGVGRVRWRRRMLYERFEFTQQVIRVAAIRIAVGNAAQRLQRPRIVVYVYIDIVLIVVVYFLFDVFSVYMLLLLLTIVVVQRLIGTGLVVLCGFHALVGSRRLTFAIVRCHERCRIV